MPIDYKKPLGRLIGTWSADLVGYGHFVLVAGLNLKDNAETSLMTIPFWETHYSRLISIHLHHEFRIWTFEIFRQVNGWNDPVPLDPLPGVSRDLAL